MHRRTLPVLAYQSADFAGTEGALAYPDVAVVRPIDAHDVVLVKLPFDCQYAYGQDAGGLVGEQHVIVSRLTW